MFEEQVIRRQQYLRQCNLTKEVLPLTKQPENVQTEVSSKQADVNLIKEDNLLRKETLLPKNVLSVSMNSIDGVVGGEVVTIPISPDVPEVEPPKTVEAEKSQPVAPVKKKRGRKKKTPPLQEPLINENHS